MFYWKAREIFNINLTEGFLEFDYFYVFRIKLQRKESKGSKNGKNVDKSVMEDTVDHSIMTEIEIEIGEEIDQEIEITDVTAPGIDQEIGMTEKGVDIEIGIVIG